MAGDGVRLSVLGLFRSTDIYRVADRSFPSSPWKVQTHTDPQRKCYGLRINTLSHIFLQASPPSLCITAVTLPVCDSVWCHVCLLPVSAFWTVKDRFPVWFKKITKLSLSVSAQLVLAQLRQAGRQTGREVGVGTKGGAGRNGCWDGSN